MANSCYSIGIGSETMLELKNMLISKYSVGITIYYQDALNLIFSCPAISDKVIKLYKQGAGYSLTAFYGDSWTSGSTIINPVQFFGISSSSGMTELFAIMGNNFILLSCLHITYGGVILITKLTNDKCIVFGAINNPGSTAAVNDIGVNTTDSTNIQLSLISKGFNANGKLYKQNIIITRTNNGVVELNSDGSIATVPELYNVSYETGIDTIYYDGSKFMSQTGMYMRGVFGAIPTAFMAEIS